MGLFLASGASADQCQLTNYNDAKAAEKILKFAQESGGRVFQCVKCTASQKPSPLNFHSGTGIDTKKSKVGAKFYTAVRLDAVEMDQAYTYIQFTSQATSAFNLSKLTGCPSSDVAEVLAVDQF